MLAHEAFAREAQRGRLARREEQRDRFGGMTPADYAELVPQLRELGVDLVDVSSGGNVATAKIPVGPGYQVPLAEQVKAAVPGLPTFAVGLVTEPAQAEAIVAEGRADAVALARAMLFEPHWPWRAAMELGAQVDVPPQYWRSQPREAKALFGDAARIGMR